MITWDKAEDTYVGIHRATGFVTRPKDLDDAIRLNARSIDVYYHINRAEIPPERIKARSTDITHIRGLLIDIDPIKADSSYCRFTTDPVLEPRSAGPGHNYWSLYNRTIDNWLGRRAPITPILSGRGVQLLLHIDDFQIDRPPLWFESRQRLALTDLSARWLLTPKLSESSKIDLSCSDLSRLARLPGSRNWKDPKSPVWAHEFPYDYILAPPLTKSEYIDFLSRYEPKPIIKPVIKDKNDFASILNLMNTTARRWVDGGADVGDRHRMAYATAKNLLELGLDPDRTIYVVGLGNRWCPNRLPDHEIHRIVRSAHSSQRESQ